MLPRWKGQIRSPASAQHELGEDGGLRLEVHPQGLRGRAEAREQVSRSIGVVDVPIESIVVDCEFAELIGLVYEYRQGDSVLALRPGRFNDRLWFCKESVGPHVGQVGC